MTVRHDRPAPGAHLHQKAWERSLGGPPEARSISPPPPGVPRCVLDLASTCPGVPQSVPQKCSRLFRQICWLPEIWEPRGLRFTAPPEETGISQRKTLDTRKINSRSHWGPMRLPILEFLRKSRVADRTVSLRIRIRKNIRPQRIRIKSGRKWLKIRELGI